MDVINCLQNGATKPLVMTQAMKSHLIHISVWGIRRWRAQRGERGEKGVRTELSKGTPNSKLQGAVGN